MGNAGMLTRAVILLFLSYHNVAATNPWNYDETGDYGPSKWPTLFPDDCGKTSQSPIDIITADAVQSTDFPNLVFTGYDIVPTQQFDFLDNGHSAQLNVLTKTMRATGASLQYGNYVLEQFHFHWGRTTCNEGSEHRINGKAYPLEIHFVHYNSDKFANVSQAASSNQDGAVAVVAVFVDVSNGTTSTEFSSLIENIVNIPDEGTHTQVNPFAVDKLMPCTSSKVYTYHGSLTTPNCAQVVIWNVFEQPIYITLEQLEKFRTIKGDALEFVEENYRPTQSLNGRTVTWFNMPAPADALTCYPFISLSGTDCPAATPPTK